MKLIKPELEHARYQAHGLIMDQLRDRGWSHVRDQVLRQVLDQMRDHVWYQVRDHVWYQVRGRVRDLIRY